MTEPREVVWSDERIRKEAMSDEYAIGLAVTIRDDLRATIDAQAQEIAELRAQVQELQAWLDGSRNNEDIALDMLGKLNDIIAALRAQVQEAEAGQWVVASDGEYAVNGVIRLVVKGPTVEFWNKLQHLITIGMYSESVAICTRKPQEGAQ